MLKIELKDRRVPVPYTYTPPAPWKNPNVPVTTAPSVTNIELFNEARRRDNIVKTLVNEFKMTEGQVVLSSVSDKEYIINKICRTYAHMGKEADWPKNDNPMIVTITSTEDGSISFCTTNYLKAKP